MARDADAIRDLVDFWNNKLIEIANSLAAKQPLDSDLTAIAALSTTSFGRGYLTLADAAAARTKAGLGSIATQDANNVAITGGAISGLTGLEVAQTTDAISFVYYGDTSVFGGNIAGKHARGTPGSPSGVLANDVLTGLYGYGFRSTGVFSGAVGAARFTAQEAFSGTGNGTQFEVAVTAIGATSRSNRFIVDPDGQWLAGAGNVVVDANRILRNRTYTRTAAPAATGIAGAQIYVTNPTSGAARPYWSNGTNWYDAAGTLLA